jgi:hypothetical protein
VIDFDTANRKRGWIVVAICFAATAFTLGAQQLGLSYEEFLETHNEKEAT